MARTRTYRTYTPGGEWARFVSTPPVSGSGAILSSGWSTCTDIQGKGDGLPFEVNKTTKNGGGRINIPYTGYYSACFQNYLADRYRSGTNTEPFVPMGIPESISDVEAATKVAAATNPSKSLVDLPVFVFEMKDFIPMLRVEGATLLKKAASANLSYHFGWKPLITDLMRLLLFHDVFNKRVKELKKLGTSGLRRTAQVGSYSSEPQTYQTYAQSAGALIRGLETKVATEKVWGYARWEPQGGFPSSDAELRALAMRAIFGLTIDPSTAWETIPWSWLVDWFSTAGDYLASRRNIVGARCEQLFVCRHKVTELHFQPPKGAAMSEFGATIETKKRVIRAPAVEAYLPFLSERQLSILGSIGVSRRVPKQ